MSLRERTRPGLGIIEPYLPPPAKAWPARFRNQQARADVRFGSITDIEVS